MWRRGANDNSSDSNHGVSNGQEINEAITVSDKYMFLF